MAPRPTAVSPQDRWLCLDLPAPAGYHEIHALQRRIVAARIDGGLKAEVVMLVEHRPVITLGRRGGRDGLRLDPDELARRGVALAETERGGEATYHGPGQLVIYPLVDLRRVASGVAAYVARLEDLMIALAAQWGVAAGRDPRGRGVWAGGRKLGSLGVAVRRGIAFHGLAFNGDMALEPFHWIHPCGLRGVVMTSLAREAGRPVPMEALRRAARRAIAALFGCRLVPVGIAELERRLP
jgi:lipoate-protein ligase B